MKKKNNSTFSQFTKNAYFSGIIAIIMLSIMATFVVWMFRNLDYNKPSSVNTYKIENQNSEEYEITGDHEESDMTDDFEQIEKTLDEPTL